MRKIIGLDIGTATFTPGGAGVGTLVFASIPGFKPGRLLAVTNVTRKAMIYMPEVTGIGGVWSSLTDTGGTLTLDYDTTSHNAADVLRPLYEAEFEPVERQAVAGSNILKKDFNGWTHNSGTFTANVGVGPTGRPAHKLVLSGPPNGLVYTAYVQGRAGGARFRFSYWVKSLGSNDFANGTPKIVLANGQNWEGYWARAVGNDWIQVMSEFVCPFDSPDYIQLTMTGYNSAAQPIQLVMSDPVLQQILPGIQPVWSPPAEYEDDWVIRPQPSTSVAWWGDSMTQGGVGNNPCEFLAGLLGGPVYNGGVASETSTQIKTRMVADNKYNYGGVVVIWAGHNNIASVSTIIADIDEMVQHLTHSRFLVLGCADWSTAPLGSAGFNNVSQLNAYLAHKYGTKFVDVRRLLTRQEAGGYTNNIYLANGDSIHLRHAGHYLVAEAVYAKIRQHGWIPDLQVGPITGHLEHSGSAMAKFTRPADTTAYTSGDVVANNTTGANVVVPALVLPFDKPAKRIRLAKSSDSLTNAQFRVHLYGVQPTLANGDNGAWSTSGAAGYVGYVDITMAQAFTDGAAGWATMEAMGSTAYQGGLWALIEARAAYTPASAETFTITVEYGP